MNKKTFKKLPVLIITLNLLIITSLLVNPVNCQQTPETRQVTGNFIDVKILVFPKSRYYLFEPSVNQQVNVTITLNFTAPPSENYEITIRTFFSLSKIVETPQNSTYTFGFWGYPPISTLVLSLPGGLKNGTIKLAGYITGRSVLFRNSVEIPILIDIESPVGYISSFSLALVPAESSNVLKVYSKFYPGLKYESAWIDGQPCLLISKLYPGVPFVMLYEHNLWTSLMVAFLVVVICLVITIPYLMRFREKLSKALKNRLTRNVSAFNEKISVFSRKLSRTLKKLHKFLMEIDSSKLFEAYVLCALLMVSSSLVFGPDPRLKVYVLSSTKANADVVEDFVKGNFAGVAITVFDEMAEFGTLASVNIFSTVIISDFVPPSEDVLVKFVYPGLDVMSRRKNGIVVLESHAHRDFIVSLQQRYGDKVVIAEDFDALQAVLAEVPRRTNILGMSIPTSLYLTIAGLAGLGSLVLVFFGTAFLACKLIELGKKPRTIGILEAVVYSIFIFLFTETMYIFCGTLLAMPLGLHAGGSRITAVGLFGFAGGSRPRMVFGFLGFILGTMISLKEGIKLDRTGLAAFLVVMLFILLDPLTGGVIFYEFILLYSVGPYTFETAAMTMSYVKDFLASIGAALGGWGSPTLKLSTGIMLYYAGAIPFCLFPKLQRGTATLLLMFSAFSVASGGIRVSNMLPWEAVISSIPGIVVGLFVASIFYLISGGELAIRKKLGGKDII